MKVIETVQIPLDRLQTFPGNPKRGDVEAIRASLKRNGQYRPIVVWKRARRNKLTVLAGNHTYLAAAEELWSSMLATILTCTEQEARRIVAVDNRAADLGVMDEEALLGLLGEISSDGGLDGTGYDAEFLDQLTTDVTFADVAPLEEPPAARLDQRSPVTCPGCGETFIPRASS
jgi:hypothetical protein